MELHSEWLADVCKWLWEKWTVQAAFLNPAGSAALTDFKVVGAVPMVAWGLGPAS